MGMKVEVLDCSGRPRSGYTVDVEWTDGRSSGQTNSNGIYDTGTSGTVKSISCYGRTLYQSGGRQVSRGDIISVTYN